jgi:hypothetical protein
MATIEKRIASIANIGSSREYLAASATTVVVSNSGSDDVEIWSVEILPSGHFQLIHKKQNKAIGFDKGEQRLQLLTPSANDDRQWWQIAPRSMDGGPFFLLRSAMDYRLVMTVEGGNVSVAADDNSSRQRFLFQAVAATPPPEKPAAS